MLSRKAVTVRHTLLAVGAVLVLGMAIYLLREVGRSPSDARTSATNVTAPPPRTADVTPARSVEPPAHAALPSAPTRPVSDAPAKKQLPPAPTEDVQPPTSARIMPTGPNPKLDAVMGEANRAYDHGEFDDAKDIARKVLEKDPRNVRMLRILVSSECIAGEANEAQKYFAQLPVDDRAQMRTRCDRYGVTLKDP
jgi:hypothetical protein